MVADSEVPISDLGTDSDVGFESGSIRSLILFSMWNAIICRATFLQEPFQECMHLK